MDAIFKRRSIRKFKNEPIPKDRIEKLLRAAMAAPSAGNGQEWEFILFQDPQKKAAFVEVSPYAFPINTAPLCILVCGNLEREAYPGDGWFVQDCSAAIENLLVEAAALDLGSVWLGVYPNKERVEAARKIFGLPEHVVPIGLVALGYGAKEKEPNDRYLEAQVHWETYQNPYDK